MRRSLLSLGMGLLLVGCGGGNATQPDEPEIQISSVPAGQPEAVVAAIDPEEALIEAHRAARRGEFETVLERLRPILDDEEYGAVAAFNSGVAAHALGRSAEAVRHYDDALQQDPTMAAAMVALIRLELSENDVDGAQLAFNRALARSGNASAIRAAGLLIGVYRGEYERVVQQAREILIEAEDNIDAHLALAQAYRGLGRNELAKLVLREAIRRDPERADLWLELATMQIEEDEEVAAIQSLREALAINPRFVEAHNNLGVLLHRARNEREAIDHLEEAVRLRPDYVEAYLNLSNALKAAGELERAERILEQAAAISPNYGPIYFNLGLLYLDTEFPGMSRVERLEAAVAQLNTYRDLMRSALPRDDPVEAYIDEALAALEAERMLQESSFDDEFEGSGGDDDLDDSSEDDFEEFDELEEFEELDGEDQWEEY